MIGYVVEQFEPDKGTARVYVATQARAEHLALEGVAAGKNRTWRALETADMPAAARANLERVMTPQAGG